MKRKKRKATQAEPCFCGGYGVVQVAGYLPGQQPMYNITCAVCLNTLTFADATSIDFHSEEEAIKAWNCAMRGELIAG